MIPIGIVGLMLGDYIDAILSSQYVMLVVGGMLLLTSALLSFAYYARPRLKENISYRDAFIIGVGQAVAAMPGLSRSGTTIATGLLLGNDKSAVATFSFLMVLAPILGQTLLDVVDGGFVVTGISVEALVAGFVAAFVVGCLACRFMIGVVKRGKLIWFALYCAIVGLVAIGTYIF
jgi:undecaprenyl-diphosphatase